MAHLERVIVLVDMDCFYCQVEEKLNAEIKGKPIAVVQYNAWRGGGIIAVNYPARSRGVTRHMRGDDALKKCPDIVLCQVPCVRGKADLTKYREAGKDVAEVLHKFTRLLERASIDEAYMDITETVNNRLKEYDKEITGNDLPTTYIYGCDKDEYLYNMYNNSIDIESNLKLIMGALIVEEIRAAVKKETGFECSAGIAHNKILAKLVCGINKPNKQTVLPHENVQILYRELPIRKIKSLGGKFGESLSEDLGITYMSELEKFSEKYLQQKYDVKTGSWLYNIARGINTDPVNIRLCPKSIGCCKRFPGKTSLRTPEDIQHWTSELASEISDRLNKELADNNRRATHMIVNYTLEINGKNISSSKSRPLPSYDHNKIAADAFEVVHKANTMIGATYKNPVTYLGIIAGKFDEGNQNIQNFFNKTNSTSSKNNSKSIENIEDQQVDLVFQPSCSGTSFFTNILKGKGQQKEERPQKEPCSTPIENKENQDNSISEYQLCSECNKQIPIADVDAHADYHYALKIAAEGKVKSEPKTGTDKSTTKVITTFFQKLPEPRDNEPMEICDQCNQSILLREFLEHLDYHAAKKLNDEINKQRVVASQTPQTSQKVKTVAKVTNAKRNIKNNSENSANKKMKSIVNFFKAS